MALLENPVRLVAVAAILAGATLLSASHPVNAIAQAVAPSTSAKCNAPLSGRTITVPPGQAGFGSVQHQPPLPLRPNEYVITIDDGPLHTTTPVLLDILHKNCINATFFLIGRRAHAAPDLVRRILKEGNGLGSHSQTHPNFSTMSLDAIRQEIETGANSVDRAAYGGAKGGRKLRLMRLPGGSGTPLIPPANWLAILRANGLVLAGVDASPEDWRNQPPEMSFQRLMKRLPDRGVILLHDGQSNTPALLEMILKELRRKDAKIVTLLG